MPTSNVILNFLDCIYLDIYSNTLSSNSFLACSRNSFACSRKSLTCFFYCIYMIDDFFLYWTDTVSVYSKPLIIMGDIAIHNTLRPTKTINITSTNS